jgi:iron complex outermembrane receptor protein
MPTFPRTSIHTSLAAVFLVFLIGSAQAEVPARIQLLDPQNQSVPGAHVQVRARGTRSVTTLTADPEGTAELRVELPFDLLIEAKGFEVWKQRVISLPASGALTVRLRPAGPRTSVDVAVRDEPASTSSSVTGLEIDRTGARTVFDAVDRVVPGAFVTRRGVMGYGISTNGTGAVSIRGIGESPNTEVLIVVDGRPDYQGMMGHPLPDFYSLSDVGSVTVTEGPASVLYGSNAMGGVVEIRNWEPPEGMTTRLAAGFGSYNTGQYNLTHGVHFRRGFYSVNAGVAHTSGDRPSSAFRDQDGTVTAGYDLAPTWKASVEGRYGHFHVEDPGPVNAPLSDSYSNVGRGGFSANLDNATGRTWGYARVFSSYGNHYITDGFRSTDRTTGVRLDQNVVLAPQLTLELGSDVVDYGGKAHDAIRHYDYGQHYITTEAGFMRAQWDATHLLRLHSGVRYENNSQFGSIAAPEVGLSFKLADGYAVSAEVGKGYRNPTIRELYLFPAPNPLLQPEHLWNYQVSLQAHPVRSLSTTVAAYYADLSNLVVTTGRWPNMQLLNAGGVLNRGIEATGRWRVQKRVTLQSGYAYLRSTNLAPYLPARKFTYNIDVDAGRAFITFGGASIGRRWGDSQRTQDLGAYTLGTLKLTVPVTRTWRLFMMVDNLFDRNYVVVPGYPMPGVMANGGMTVGF